MPAKDDEEDANQEDEETIGANEDAIVEVDEPIAEDEEAAGAGEDTIVELDEPIAEHVAAIAGDVVLQHFGGGGAGSSAGSLVNRLTSRRSTNGRQPRATRPLGCCLLAGITSTLSEDARQFRAAQASPPLGGSG